MANIWQQAAAQLENGIRAAFTAEKLGIHILLTEPGPRTLTTSVRLHEPDVKSLARVSRMVGAIEARSGVSPIRIHSAGGVVYIEAPSPQPLTVYAADMRGSGLAVPLGVTPRSAVAGVDFERDYHMLAVAPTGGGKTTAIRALLYQLARQHTAHQVRIIISTVKLKDWMAFDGLAHCGGLITDVGETVQMINWLAGVMYARGRTMKSTPVLFVVLDDLINLMDRAPELAPVLAEIASLGGGAGIHLLIGTQRLGKKGTGSSVVAGNITARLVFRTVSAQDAALFTGRGDTGAESLGDQPGDGILITTSGGVQRIAVGIVTDDDLAALPRGESARPWLAAGTRTGTIGGIPANEGQNGRSEGDRTGIPAGGGVTFPLAYRPPTPDEQWALIALYNRKGTKNQTLATAYAQGKTPKSLGWLNGALARMGVRV